MGFYKQFDKSSVLAQKSYGSNHLYETHRRFCVFKSKSLIQLTIKYQIYLYLKPLSICESSSTLIRVDGDYLYVDVDITELDATIKISDYFEGSAPVMLVNALNKPITYGQKGKH